MHTKGHENLRRELGKIPFKPEHKKKTNVMALTNPLLQLSSKFKNPQQE
jgi:hypothetical protein